MLKIIKALNQAEDEAKRLLKNPSFLHKKVNVEGIAKQLGILIKKEQLKDDISGIIKINSNEGKPIIVVNKLHVPSRQRFTIAHEICHFILHKDSNVHVDAPVYFRDTEAAAGKKIQEMQANRFAAALLMPEHDLKQRFNKLIEEKQISEATFDEHFSKIIDELTDFYDVSKEALTIRLGKVLG